MKLEVFESSIDSTKVNQIVNELKAGELVIVPTDSVYSVCCSLDKPKALEKLAKIKGLKPNQAKFSMMCASISEADKYAKHIDSQVFRLIKANTPGPFTFILKASTEVPKLFNAKRKEIGIRIPDNEITQAVIEALGCPLVGTSVHDDDEIIEYTTNPDEIYEKWQEHIGAMLDGGYGNNKATTVINCTEGEPVVVREGLGEIK